MGTLLQRLFGTSQKPVTVFSGAPLQTKSGPELGKRVLNLDSYHASELFTPEALRLAWFSVRKAGGGPGADHVTIAQFEQNLANELDTLRAELAEGRYVPRPPRRAFIPKSSEGLRPLVLWALRDRIAQRVVHDILSPIFEPTFLPCSFGFRRGLGVQDAVQAVIAHRDSNLRWIVDGDIRNCFEEIDHKRLLSLLQPKVRHPLLIHYIKGWLTAGLFTGADGRPRMKGASQGSVLSPLFANIYLHEVDTRLTKHGLAYVRYADDFVICCRRRNDAEEAMALMAKSLQRVGMELHPQKTRVAHLDSGISWLGYFLVHNDCYRL